MSQKRCDDCRSVSALSIGICRLCDEVFVSPKKNPVYCSIRCCNGVPRSAEDRRLRRDQREAAAPGLTAYKRTKLRKRWVEERRRCEYCPSVCETVDHVVPLVRGGTNEISNLVPACRSCNSSKGSRLLSEWRVNDGAATYAAA